MQNLSNMWLFLEYTFICTKNFFCVFSANQIVHFIVPIELHTFKWNLQINKNPDSNYYISMGCMFNDYFKTVVFWRTTVHCVAMKYRCRIKFVKVLLNPIYNFSSELDENEYMLRQSSNFRQ